MLYSILSFLFNAALIIVAILFAIGFLRMCYRAIKGDNF